MYIYINIYIYTYIGEGLPAPHFFVADTSNVISAYSFVAQLANLARLKAEVAKEEQAAAGAAVPITDAIAKGLEDAKHINIAHGIHIAEATGTLFAPDLELEVGGA